MERSGGCRPVHCMGAGGMVYARAILGWQRVYQSPWRRRRPSEDSGFVWQELRTLGGLKEDLRSDEPVPPQSEYSSPCLVHAQAVSQFARVPQYFLRKKFKLRHCLPLPSFDIAYYDPYNEYIFCIDTLYFAYSCI